MCIYECTHLLSLMDEPLTVDLLWDDRKVPAEIKGGKKVNAYKPEQHKIISYWGQRGCRLGLFINRNVNVFHWESSPPSCLIFLLVFAARLHRFASLLMWPDAMMCTGRETIDRNGSSTPRLNYDRFCEICGLYHYINPCIKKYIFLVCLVL